MCMLIHEMQLICVTLLHVTNNPTCMKEKFTNSPTLIYEVPQEEIPIEHLSANKDQLGRVTDLIPRSYVRAAAYGKGYIRVDACMHVARRVLLVQYCKTELRGFGGMLPR